MRQILLLSFVVIVCAGFAPLSGSVVGHKRSVEGEGFTPSKRQKKENGLIGREHLERLAAEQRAGSVVDVSSALATTGADDKEKVAPGDCAVWSLRRLRRQKEPVVVTVAEVNPSLIQQEPVEVLKKLHEMNRCLGIIFRGRSFDIWGHERRAHFVCDTCQHNLAFMNMHFFESALSEDAKRQMQLIAGYIKIIQHDMAFMRMQEKQIREIEEELHEQSKRPFSRAEKASLLFRLLGLRTEEARHYVSLPANVCGCVSPYLNRLWLQIK